MRLRRQTDNEIKRKCRMVDTIPRSLKAVQGMSRRQPWAAWLCGRVCCSVGVLGEEVRGHVGAECLREGFIDGGVGGCAQ